MSLELVALFPHPPIVVPEVGRGEEEKARATVAAMTRLAEMVAGARPDRLLVISPHAPFLGDVFYLRANARVHGDLSAFGAGEVRVETAGDPALAERLARELLEAGFPVLLATEAEEERYGLPRGLDHGAMVPLSYIWRAGVRVPVLEMGIADLRPAENRRVGGLIGRILRSETPRTVLVASGDLSHRLFPGAPAGYSPEGEVFDRRIVAALEKGSAEEIASLPERMVEAAGECGYRPLLMALGALEDTGFESEVLGYEGPWGVGYGVAVLRPGLRREGPLPSLARRALESYLTTGRTPEPGEFPDLPRRAGVFVTLKKGGQLRGCIGTYAPTHPTLGEEVVHNALSAGLADPRFPPVSPAELGELEISVDVLEEPERVESLADLDPRVYGVIVRKGHRTGLLLPDLEGVDTVEEQLAIARQKAGIGPEEEGVEVYRFRVQRYH